VQIELVRRFDPISTTRGLAGWIEKWGTACGLTASQSGISPQAFVVSR